MTQIFDPPVDYSTQRTGSLIVITGSMFSGKTEELIRRVTQGPLRPPQRTGLQARHRHPLGEHRDTVPQRRPARSTTPSRRSEELLEKVEETTNVVAIEEAQFFDEGISRGLPDDWPMRETR